MQIRMARVEDALALLAIYAPYIEKTAITYEYTVPTLEEFAQRIKSILQKYPYLVLEENGEIQGYAYASAFRTRAAYAWCAETSIYLRMDSRQKGYGRALLEKLEELLARQGILTLYACIAYHEREDEVLSHASLHFHSKMGYTKAAHVHRCAYKLDRWLDLVIMEKMLGGHPHPPAPVTDPVFSDNLV